MAYKQLNEPDIGHKTRFNKNFISQKKIVYGAGLIRCICIVDRCGVWMSMEMQSREAWRYEPDDRFS